MELATGELASLAGVSVRTLHHYDEVGLLRPTGRTRAGHRRYGAEDVERLHRILVYRKLGFELSQIGEILAAGDVDDLGHLRRQQALLREQRRRVNEMLRGVERLMEAKRSGVNLTPGEMREVFGTFDPAEHAEEAEARWGETDAYRESRRRASKYGKAEWLAIKEEAQGITDAFAALLRSGAAPTDEAALELAERHRQHIGRWFYDCPPAVHRGLGELYVADARFTKTYDDVLPGLAGFISAAFIANAARAGS